MEMPTRGGRYPPYPKRAPGLPRAVRPPLMSGPFSRPVPSASYSSTTPQRPAAPGLLGVVVRQTISSRDRHHLQPARFEEPVMTDALRELRAACKDSSATTLEKKLADGEAIWIRGLAVPAESGHVALSMSEGHSMTVPESAVLEVVRDGSHFLVRVRSGTPVLARVERVMTLQSGNQSCDCDSEATPDAVARQSGSGSSGSAATSKVTVWCYGVRHCVPWTDKDGLTREFCVVYPVCVPI
jgi:hypothetical protein